jgi:hypothetical protein
MTNDTDIVALRQPESVDDPLTEIARDGARRMLAAALRAEANAFVASHAENGGAKLGHDSAAMLAVRAV